MIKQTLLEIDDVREAHRLVKLRNTEIEKERAEEEKEDLERMQGWNEEARKLYERII